MIILSQDRKSIINTSQCTEIAIFEGYDDDDNKVLKIAAGTPTPNTDMFYTEGYRTLGQYDSEEEAKKIIFLIFSTKSAFVMPERNFNDIRRNLI